MLGVIKFKDNTKVNMNYIQYSIRKHKISNIIQTKYIILLCQ